MALIEYDEYKQRLRDLGPELEKLSAALDMDSARAEARKLEDETAQDGFWNDLERSQKVQQRLKQLQNKIARQDKLVTEWQDLTALCEMGQEADDAVASRQVAAANLDVARKQLELLLAGSREEDVAQALAQYNQAKASLTIREQNLKDAVLYAPGNGVVRNRILEKGDMASPQKPVYNISLNHTKWVRAYLTESQLGKVKPGFSATVRNDSFPDTGFKGTVGFISSVAEFTPKNVETPDLRTALVYEVRIIVDDPDNRLRLGAPATVTIPLGQNAGTQPPEQPRP